jgi:peptidoglycan-associated lipoprotein
MKLRTATIIAALLLASACSSDYDSADGAMGGEAPPSSGMTDTSVSDMGTDLGGTSAAQAQLDKEVGSKVFFGYDSYSLSDEGKNTLQQQAQWLKNYPSLNVSVEGHADERGTRDYNLALGERRATSTKNFLVSQGVDAGRVSAVSYGKERPEVMGSTEEAWSKNRRTVTVVE